MSLQRLPTDYDERLRRAVQTFWRSRHSTGDARQGGTRDAVTSGKNMDGFCELVRVIAVHCGLPSEAVHTRRGSGTLPGYYRATKAWDVVVIHRGRPEDGEQAGVHRELSPATNPQTLFTEFAARAAAAALEA